MADINVQRKGRSIWPWLLTLLLVLVVAAAVWWYLGSERAGPETADEFGTVAPEASPPAYDPATAPPYPATSADTLLPADTMP